MLTLSWIKQYWHTIIVHKNVKVPWLHTDKCIHSFLQILLTITKKISSRKSWRHISSILQHTTYIFLTTLYYVERVKWRKTFLTLCKDPWPNDVTNGVKWTQIDIDSNFTPQGLDGLNLWPLFLLDMAD